MFIRFKKDILFAFIVLVLAVFVISSSCSFNKEQQLDKDLLQGTWRGTLTYKQLNEVKTYAPMLEDSLTTLVDTMIVIPDVGIDIAKTETRFWNIDPFSSSVFLYEWDKNKLTFQKKKMNKRIPDTASSISTYVLEYSEPPYAIVQKLDNDSLVLQLAIYSDSWNEYLLKLKRK